MTIPKRPRRAMTPAEHEDWLKATGQYDAMIERHRQHDAELKAHWAACEKALIPVVDALQAAGCPVSSPYDMLRLANENPRLYIAAIPILLDHLQRPYPSDARVQIAFALYSRAAEVVWDQLIALFRKETDERVKDRLANAIEACSSRERLDDVINLVRDSKNGTSRVLLIGILTHSRDPRARETIMDLIDDPDLKIQIALYLKGRKKRMH